MCHPYNWKLISYSQRVWHSILIRQIFSIWFLFLLYFTGIYLCAFYISPPIDTTIDSISHLKFLPHSYIHNFLESLILVLFQKGKVVLRRLSDLSKVTWLFCLPVLFVFFFFHSGDHVLWTKNYSRAFVQIYLAYWVFTNVHILKP